MITKINLNKVASYKSQATLETDKALNLIYGLNGTGKSTLSNYLLKKTDEKFKDCSVVGLDENHEILVYNQIFIQENFFESESLKGIFTLSKENKEAITTISNAQKKIEKLDGENIKKTEELKTEKTSVNKKFENAKNIIWKIKTDFSGGDRVLEFCLEGHKGSKDNLFKHIQGLTKPTEQPTKSIDNLKNEVQTIMGENARKYAYVPKITFSSSNIETEKIFEKQIVGNENSSVSKLITKLGNSDWVKSGLKHLPEVQFEKNKDCPFCQEKTISNELIENIKDYFDASYEVDIKSIKKYLGEYLQAIQQIPSKTIFEANPKFETFKQDFEIKFNEFKLLIKSNKEKIEEKIKKPSVPKTLENSTKLLEKVNEVISKINASILEHNNKIDKKATIKKTIKKTFWQIMRWDYNQTISSYLSDKSTSKTKTDLLNKVIKGFNTTILEQKSIISEQQKQTVNIEKQLQILMMD